MKSTRLTLTCLIILVKIIKIAESSESMFLKEQMITQPYRKKIAFGPICHFMLNEELKTELKGHYYSQSGTKTKACLSATAWEWSYCSSRHMRLVKRTPTLL